MGGYAWEALIQFTVAIKFTINIHQTLFPVNVNEFIKLRTPRTRYQLNLFYHLKFVAFETENTINILI